VDGRNGVHSDGVYFDVFFLGTNKVTELDRLAATVANQASSLMIRLSVGFLAIFCVPQTKLGQRPGAGDNLTAYQIKSEDADMALASE
tara:strand:- start:8353 stop:8616 length:264 start_codon:yes stop_codon:yes gene_type:complete